MEGEEGGENSLKRERKEGGERVEVIVQICSLCPPTINILARWHSDVVCALIQQDHIHTLKCP